MPQPTIGAAAPGFSLPASGGQTISLASLSGSKVVLFLYPRDDTKGCTAEAIDFTGQLSAFEAEGAVVLGLSTDSIASHEKFIAKHDLGVALLSDEDAAVATAYGAWVEKSMYGRKFLGIERSTFLIDEAGVLRQAWRKVRVPGHVDAVLDAVRAL